MASLRVALLAVTIYLSLLLWGLMTPLIGNGPGAAVGFLFLLTINYLDGKYHG